MTEAEIRYRYGTPGKQEGSVWRYNLPRHCSDWRDRLTVHFKKGRVIKATAETYYSGDHCDFEP